MSPSARDCLHGVLSVTTQESAITSCNASRKIASMVRTSAYVILSGVFLLALSAFAPAQAPAPIPGLPRTLASWHFETDKNVLTISAGAKTDWFVDPFDGTVANTAPILLFTPHPDCVLSAKSRRDVERKESQKPKHYENCSDNCPIEPPVESCFSAMSITPTLPGVHRATPLKGKERRCKGFIC
jgi:hypothetical protein